MQARKFFLAFLFLFITNFKLFLTFLNNYAIINYIFMNKIGKMGRKNSKIPGLRMKSQKRPQEEVKRYIELSAEGKRKLKATVSEYCERYVKGGKYKKESIILNIFNLNRLDIIGTDSIEKVIEFIGSEKQRRKRENEKILIPIEGPKCRNKLSLSVLEKINGFIIKKNLHTEYLEAEYNKIKRANITKRILRKFKIENCSKNRKMIHRLILQTTFKSWSDKEEKALEELLHEKIDVAVWNELRDNKKTNQTRKQIMSEFKKQLPASEHNDYDIMNKMSLLVCKIKRTTPKQMEVGQIEPVRQAIYHVIEKQMQLTI